MLLSNALFWVSTVHFTWPAVLSFILVVRNKFHLLHYPTPICCARVMCYISMKTKNGCQRASGGMLSGWGTSIRADPWGFDFVLAAEDRFCLWRAWSKVLPWLSFCLLKLGWSCGEFVMCFCFSPAALCKECSWENDIMKLLLDWKASPQHFVSWLVLIYSLWTM